MSMPDLKKIRLLQLLIYIDWSQHGVVKALLSVLRSSASLLRLPLCFAQFIRIRIARDVEE